MVFKNGLNDETISYAINITRGFTLNMYLVTQSTSKTIWNKKHSSAAMFFVDSRSGMAQNWIVWKFEYKHRHPWVGAPDLSTVSTKTKNSILKSNFYVSRGTSSAFFWKISNSRIYFGLWAKSICRVIKLAFYCPEDQFEKKIEKKYTFLVFFRTLSRKFLGLEWKFFGWAVKTAFYVSRGTF